MTEIAVFPTAERFSSRPVFTGTEQTSGREKEEACTRRAGTDDGASPQAVAAFRVQALERSRGERHAVCFNA